MNTPAKLQTIADEAGVSRMTVSRALRNHPKVNAETRSRILEIAARVGYRPNPLVSALMADVRAKKSGPSGQVLAFITCDESRDHWKNFHTTREFYEGAAESGRKLGYRVEHFWLWEKGRDARALSKVLYARGINGILIAPLPAWHVDYNIDWSQFAAVGLGYSLRSPVLHHVANHQYKTIRVVVQRLRRIGYQRIGLWVTNDADRRVMHNWRAGYLVEQTLNSPAKSLPILFTEDAATSFPAFQKWFLRYRPDAIITLEEQTLSWLEQMGVAVPETGVAHLDLSPEMIGRIAGADQNSRFVAAAAIDVIVGQHHRNERGIPQQPKYVLIEGRWVDGPTVKSEPSA